MAIIITNKFKMMLNKKTNRSSKEVNAGSMADIAFLLLIFFLVTTTIVNDKGITVKLPPPVEDNTPIQPIGDRNVLSVKINKHNALLVEAQETNINQLKEHVKTFILNPEGNQKLSKSPKQAVVSLQNDRETKYEAYIAVYNELKSAYNEIWDERAIQLYDKHYGQIDVKKQREIRNQIPLVISEAEPTAY